MYKRQDAKSVVREYIAAEHELESIQAVVEGRERSQWTADELIALMHRTERRAKAWQSLQDLVGEETHA